MTIILKPQRALLTHGGSELDVIKQITSTPAMKKYRKEIEKLQVVIRRNNPTLTEDEVLKRAAKIAVRV